MDISFKICHYNVQNSNCACIGLLLLSEFAASEPVPGFNDGTLQLAFADLRQLLDLFLNDDWSTYLADFGNPKAKYVRVKPQVAINIMEK